MVAAPEKAGSGPARTGNGQFAPGKSGNPAGRPKGTSGAAKARAAADKWARDSVCVLCEAQANKLEEDGGERPEPVRFESFHDMIAHRAMVHQGEEHIELLARFFPKPRTESINVNIDAARQQAEEALDWARTMQESVPDSEAPSADG